MKSFIQTTALWAAVCALGTAIGPAAADGPGDQKETVRFEESGTVEKPVIDPLRQFQDALQAGNYDAVRQTFRKASMQDRIRCIYGFTAQPQDAMEIDSMLLDHLRDVQDIVDSGTEMSAARNGASGKIMNYLGAKYGFIPPELDVWARGGQRKENLKIAEALAKLEAAMGMMDRPNDGLPAKTASRSDSTPWPPSEVSITSKKRSSEEFLETDRSVAWLWWTLTVLTGIGAWFVIRFGKCR